jgi:hypothetical protein
MRIAIAAAVSLCCACGPTAPYQGGDGDGAGGAVDAGGTERADARPVVDWPDAAPSAVCDKMDILFVIDNSGSMGQEQDNLAANFPHFISVLESFTNADGDLIDYHVGVTTTGVSKSYQTQTIPGWPNLSQSQSGDDGQLQAKPACNMTNRWLARGEADVASKFSCAASVGTSGPATEMPLEGLRLALTDRMADGANAGFLRDDALLAVVILTDEDDCSRSDNHFTLALGESLCGAPTPVASYVAAIDDVMGDRDRWAAAIIAGVGPGSCSSDLGNAQEATRLLDFAAQVGPNAITSSICEGDLATPLSQAMAVFQQACNDIVVVD